MPARPLRPGETPPKGTAVLKGQVMAAGTGTPVRRAQVRAMSMEGRGGGVTSTDAEGRYEIKELPAGRYNIIGQQGRLRPGQLRPAPSRRARHADRSADGQTAEKVNFVLSRGSVISGRIVDDGGEPVSGTRSRRCVISSWPARAGWCPAAAKAATIAPTIKAASACIGLPPGDYYVSANNRNNTMMMPGMNNTEAEGFAPTYYPGTPNIARRRASR